MADKKISQLNAATTIFDADDFAVVQDGETKQANASVVKNYVKDGLSKSDVGLGNVDNTSDLNKPISTATQTALDGKEPADATLLKSAAIGVSVQAYDADLTAWAGKIAPTGNAVGTSDSQTLTNKTISGSNNTLSNIGNTSLTNSSITINGNAVILGGSTTVTATASNPLTLGTGLTGTSYNGSSAVTVAIDTSVVTTLTGTQTLTNKTLSGANNTLSNIGNSSLVNSSITFGATAVSLGGTVSGFNGVSIGASSASTGAFTNLSYTGTLTGGTGVIAIGTNQIYKDASGNVGIGTSSPGAKLDVQGGRSYFASNNDAFAIFLRYNASTNGVFIGSPSANAFQISNAGGSPYLHINSTGVVTIGSAISLDPTTANSLVVNSSGNVGIGTASPTSVGTYSSLCVNGTNGAFLEVFANGSRIGGIESGTGALYVQSTANVPLILRSNSTERARFDSNGNFNVASQTATPSGGSTAARLIFGTTAGFGIYYGSGAPTVSAAQGSIYLRSDGSSTSTRLYVNTNGSTTWTNVTTAA
jgi:hypothetical protein